MALSPIGYSITSNLGFHGYVGSGADAAALVGARGDGAVAKQLVDLPRITPPKDSSTANDATRRQDDALPEDAGAGLPRDTVQISAEGRSRAAAETGVSLRSNGPAPNAGNAPVPKAAGNGGRAAEAETNDRQLSNEQQAEIEQLKETDRKVRAHEAAHVAAGGAHVQGAASFAYTVGPDGRQYAVAGEVQIDASPVSGDAAATLQKLETVRAAALAPADPSGQDRAVAAQAAVGIAEARAAVAKQRQEEVRAAGRAGNSGQANNVTAPAGTEDANAATLIAAAAETGRSAPTKGEQVFAPAATGGSRFETETQPRQETGTTDVLARGRLNQYAVAAAGRPTGAQVNLFA